MEQKPIEFLCGCGRRGYVARKSPVKYIFEDNKIGIYRGSCMTCKIPYICIEDVNAEFSEIVFPSANYFGETLCPFDFNRIIVSYIPVVSERDNNKREILSIRKDGDMVIGSDGWEDVVVDKSMLGSWNMTRNSPPIFDILINEMVRKSFGKKEILSSYFLSPVSYLLGYTYSLINGRTVDYFKNIRVMKKFQNLYVGVENGQS